MEKIRNNRVFEDIFDLHHDALGADLALYKGHCYRLFNYMSYWNLTQEEIQLCEIAIPFHDIGIWTHKTMDYLHVSFDVAKSYIAKNDIEIDLTLLEDVIVNHHKISAIKKCSLANKLRKADMIDLTFGYIKYDVPKATLKSIAESIPYSGFQKLIYKKVLAHAAKNITSPFPMLRW